MTGRATEDDQAGSNQPLNLRGPALPYAGWIGSGTPTGPWPRTFPCRSCEGDRTHMSRLDLRHLACVAWLVVGAGMLRADEFVSLKGYRMDGPRGWLVCGRDDPKLMARVERGELPGLANLNFDTIDVVFLDPEVAAGVGLTVGFRTDSAPFDATARERWTTHFRNQATKPELKFVLQTIGEIDVGGMKGLSFKTRWSYPGDMVQQWQVLVSSGTHLLLFTFFGPPEIFDSYWPEFRTTMASVRLANSPDRWRWLWPVVLSSLAGAAIGASLTTGAGWVINRRRTQRQGPPRA